MRKKRTITGTLIALILVASCADEVQLPTGPVDVTVMTRNVYVGTDVDRIITAQTAEEFVMRVAEMWQMLHATDFAERAEALADEIAGVRPHLVGLQEITVFRTQSPGDAVIGGTVPAEDVYLDYLAILMDKLVDRGLSYTVVASMEGTDVEVPLPLGNGSFDDVRMTDYDVVITRTDVGLSNAQAATYAATLPVTSPAGAAIEIRRGWVAVDAEIEGKTIRFVNTHLEPADYTDLVQARQLAELQQLLGNESVPIVLVGDLNSEADGSGTPTYQSLLTAGFLDVHGLDPTPDGAALTCCHDLGLRNGSVRLTKRIDHILLANTPVVPEVDAWIVGDDLADRTASGLWPSDHAGVVARLTFQGN